MTQPRLPIPSYTRNQARSLIRIRPELANSFLVHPDRNVVRTAKFALTFRGIPIGLPQEPEPIQPDSEIAALAEKYGEPYASVSALVAEKGSVIAAKRSLAAKLGAKNKLKKAS